MGELPISSIYEDIDTIERVGTATSLIKECFAREHDGQIVHTTGLIQDVWDRKNGDSVVELIDDVCGKLLLLHFSATTQYETRSTLEILARWYKGQRLVVKGNLHWKHYGDTMEIMVLNFHEK